MGNVAIVHPRDDERRSQIQMELKPSEHFDLLGFQFPRQHEIHRLQKQVFDRDRGADDGLEIDRSSVQRIEQIAQGQTRFCGFGF